MSLGGLHMLEIQIVARHVHSIWQNSFNSVVSFSVENTAFFPCYSPWYIPFNMDINVNAFLGLCFSFLILNYLSTSPQIVYLEFHLWPKRNCLIVQYVICNIIMLAKLFPGLLNYCDYIC